MSEPLNYRMPHSRMFYRPPARMHRGRTLLGILVASILGLIGALAYVKLVPHLDHIWLRGGAFVAAVVVTAGLAVLPTWMGRVYIAWVAIVSGFAVSLFTVYAVWIVWLRDVLALMQVDMLYTDLVLQPGFCVELAREVNRYGTWSYNDHAVRGPVATIFWVLESGAMLLAGTLAPIKFLANEDPVCHGCNRRCQRTVGFPRFADDRQDDLLAAVENRDFRSLVEHSAPEHEDAPELSFALYTCPQCDMTNVLSVNRIAWGFDTQGVGSVRTVPLINRLLITSEETQALLAVRDTIREQRASSDAADPL